MAVTAQFLKGIMAEARPIIERQMNDAKLIAGFRTVVANNGGDWGALKALIKASVQDDEDGGTRVQKIVDKADDTAAYADMLGLANMNENNFSARSYADEKGRGDLTTDTTDQREVMDPVAVETATDKQAACLSRPAISNSAAVPSARSNSAGEAPSSPASPATHSDDIDLTIPTFLRRDEGSGYPKREAVEA